MGARRDRTQRRVLRAAGAGAEFVLCGAPVWAWCVRDGMACMRECRERGRKAFVNMVAPTQQRETARAITRLSERDSHQWLQPQGQTQAVSRWPAATTEPPVQPELCFHARDTQTLYRVRIEGSHTVQPAEV